MVLHLDRTASVSLLGPGELCHCEEEEFECRDNNDVLEVVDRMLVADDVLAPSAVRDWLWLWLWV